MEIINGLGGGGIVVKWDRVEMRYLNIKDVNIGYF